MIAGTVLTQSKTYDFAVARSRAGGILDASFSKDGTVTTSIRYDAYAYAVVLQTDGRIVVVGESPNRIAVARYMG